MPVIAFDSKSFVRESLLARQYGNEKRKNSGFHSQLGVGVLVKDNDNFTKAYTKKVLELKNDFRMEDDVPFLSSTHLKRVLGLDKAIVFADKLITSLQDCIDEAHFSYAILPSKRIPEIEVGGYKCPVKYIPTPKFLDNLGPMFSYLTAYSYLYSKSFINVDNLEFHIDAFRSNETYAWNAITKYTRPKVFFRGDECNPFISCADIVSFLTDAKLYIRKFKLEPGNIKEVWSDYTFCTNSYFLDDKSLSAYSWKSNVSIDFRKFLAKPTIFLLIDEIEKLEYGEETEYDSGSPDGDSQQKPRKFHEIIKTSEIYFSAVRYAYSSGGCVKIFRREEDMNMVSDGDVLVYMGSKSKKVAETLNDAWDVEIVSGRELKRKMKKS